MFYISDQFVLRRRIITKSFLYFWQFKYLLIFQIKKLGSCEVPLEELVIPPFIICRDFLFAGPGFSASALVRFQIVLLLIEKISLIRLNKSYGICYFLECFLPTVAEKL